MSGRFSEAIELYEKAVSLDFLGLSALMALAGRDLKVGRIDDAFDAFDRVRAINPDYPRLSRELGQAFMMQGDLENALLEDWKAMPPEYGGPPKRDSMWLSWLLWLFICFRTTRQGALMWVNCE